MEAGHTPDSACFRIIDRIERLDLRTRKRSGRLCTRPWTSATPIALSADDTAITLQPEDFNGLELIDFSTGRTLRRELHAPEAGPRVSLRSTYVHPGGPITDWHIHTPGWQQPRMQWSLTTPDAAPARITRRLMALESAPIAGSPAVHPLSAAAGGGWLIVAWETAGANSQRAVVETIPAEGDPPPPFAVDPWRAGGLAAVIARPEPALVVAEPGSAALRRFTLAGGEPLAPIPLPAAEGTGFGLASAASGSRLLSVTGPGCAVVYDAASERWTARLQAPPSAKPPEFLLSPRGGHAAAVMPTARRPSPSSPARRGATRVILWDLGGAAPPER